MTQNLPIPLTYPLPERNWHKVGRKGKLQLWASKEWTPAERAEAERGRVKQLVIAAPPVFNSLEAYIRAVSAFPMLTPERELALARLFRDEGDLKAASELISSHLRSVVKIARDYQGYGLPMEDLIQEGNIGLMKALKNFDPERGFRFFTLAVHSVRAEMHEYIIRNWRLVKLATTKQQRKLFFNLRKLKPGLGPLKLKDVNQIAQKLNVKPSDVKEMEVRMYGEDVPFEPSSDEEDELNRYPNLYPTTWLSTHEEPSQLVEESQLAELKAQRLRKALETLDPRSRRIIEARWLTNEQDPASLAALAKEFNVSGERIRQIEVKAIRQLRYHAAIKT